MRGAIVCFRFVLCLTYTTTLRIKVVYLLAARQQPEDAVMYIAVDLIVPDATMNFADEADEAVRKLKVMPYRFPIYHALYAMKHEIRFFR